ncbi:lipase family protein [Corynebacterium ulceribovis]|uniref:lipase family protein n=1 Tax=Corynebacterium ulceribovis TaxID=487732 RepID=UPI0003709115|nr:lipase family protein [Corynebacterium ulceribovis]
MVSTKLKSVLGLLASGALLLSSGAHAAAQSSMPAPGLPAPGVPGSSLPGSLQPGGQSGSAQQAPGDAGDTKTLPQGTSDFTPLPSHPAPAPNRGLLVSQKVFAIAEGNGSGSATTQGLTAKKVTYRTTDSVGGQLTTSGVLTVPKQPWRGRGPRPLVAVAPGTQGVGKHCDASNAFRTGVQLRINPVDAVMPYEAVIVAPLLAAGYAVVAIDHPRDPHTGSQKYVDNIASGQALIDAAAASLQAMGAPKETKVGFTGYSQGGGAAGWAAENVHRYAPELSVKASYVGAPPSDLMQVMRAVDGSLIAGVLAYATNQTLDNIPELREELEQQELSPLGLHTLRVNDSLCIAGSAFASGLADTRTMMRSRQSLMQVAHRYPQLLQALERQKLGQDHPRHPVLLGSGRHDDIIPHGQVTDVFHAWRSKGTPVRYRVDETPHLPGKLGINHMIPYMADLPHILALFKRHLG